MLEYLRICYFSKNVAFYAIEDFQQGKEYHLPDVKTLQCICYTWASRNIFVSNTSETKIETEATLWQTSLWICAERMLLTGALPTTLPTSVSTKHWELYHYQAFTRVSLSIYSHFDSILNEDQLKCTSYKSFKQ